MPSACCASSHTRIAARGAPKAVAMPGNAFSDPGPYCMANTPGGLPLVTRA